MRKYLYIALAITLSLTSCTKNNLEPIARDFDWKVMIYDSDGNMQYVDIVNVVVAPVVSYEADSTKSYNQLIDADFEPIVIIDSHLIY